PDVGVLPRGLGNGLPSSGHDGIPDSARATAAVGTVDPGLYRPGRGTPARGGAPREADDAPRGRVAFQKFRFRIELDATVKFEVALAHSCPNHCELVDGIAHALGAPHARAKPEWPQLKDLTDLPWRLNRLCEKSSTSRSPPTGKRRTTSRPS